MTYTLLNNKEDTVAPRTPNRSRYLLTGLIFGGSFLFFLLNDYTVEMIYYTNEPLINKLKSYNEDNFAINTEGCTIPGMKPFDQSIKEFVQYPENLPKCPNAEYPLISSNRTHLWINKNNKTLSHYKILSTEHLTCCYITFYRPTMIFDINANNIDDRVVYNKCIRFFEMVKVDDDEFVTIQCFYGEKTVYKQYFIFAPKKPIILHDGVKEISKNKSAYNVIILGIDNVSRLNFHRTMPKTLEYLLNNGAVELMGYNKVGDNSYPNLVALLTGHDETQLVHICYPFLRAAFDECPFLWHWYKKAGYYTAFGEDIATLGTFNYLSNGFTRKPTDYYTHPFIVEAQKKVGSVKHLNAEICMGDKYFYKVLLDYVEDLTVALDQSKMFAFFWEITMSHDYLNYPMIMDEHYVEFLKRLNTRKYLDKSIIIVMSDHGIRWGGIRSTKQGRLEEHLPFVFMLTPASFKNTYRDAYRNLMANSRRLTTPFDMHKTLLDLIDVDTILDEKIALRTKEPYAIERGISLFLPVPSNRTCQTARIADHWCTCHSSKKISSTSQVVKDAASWMVQQMNDKTKEHPECMNLTLYDTLRASEIVPISKDKKESDWKEYLIVIKTEPGSGVFEATLRNLKGNWSLAGSISRLNLYGNQSWCVNDAHLKMYCYCA